MGIKQALLSAHRGDDLELPRVLDCKKPWLAVLPARGSPTRGVFQVLGKQSEQGNPGLALACDF